MWLLVHAGTKVNFHVSKKASDNYHRLSRRSQWSKAKAYFFLHFWAAILLIWSTLKPRGNKCRCYWIIQTINMALYDATTSVMLYLHISILFGQRSMIHILIQGIPMWQMHSADRSIKLSGSHRTQTQTSKVRWTARSSGHWVVASMFA